MHRLPIERFRWPPGIEEKGLAKHGLFAEEVEESFSHPEAKLRRTGDRYILLSRTYAGSYIIVILAFAARIATIISARKMTAGEWRLFRRK